MGCGVPGAFAVGVAQGAPGDGHLGHRRNGGGVVAVKFQAGIDLIDGAVAAVQHGGGVRRLAVVQVLVPGQGARAGGAVEQPGHLAGGELCDGLADGSAAPAADAQISCVRRPVAVLDGSVVPAADAAHIANGTAPAGVITVTDDA